MRNLSTMEYDIIIIGAGVMGSAAAYYLSKSGKKILIIDQFKVKNDLNSSQDYSRVFRYEYGEDEFYTNLAVKSLKLWKEFEKDAKKQFYFQCGALLIAEGEEEYAMKSYKTLKKLGHKVDLLNERDLSDRFPQFSAKFGVLDHQGGILEASSAVESFINLAKQNGVEILENIKVDKIKKNSIILENKRVINFNKLIVTCGAWASKILDLPVKATKQQIIYFKPKNAENFSKDNFPLFAYLDKGFYGVPIHGIDAVKISNHLPGEISDPDNDRKVSEKFIQSCKDFFKEFIPELADAEVIKTKVCFYSMTSDEDFIIDKLDDNIIIGAGFSGHGFKFGPLLGKILADLALRGRTKYDISRFKLDRF